MTTSLQYLFKLFPGNAGSRTWSENYKTNRLKIDHHLYKKRIKQQQKVTMHEHVLLKPVYKVSVILTE